MTELPPPRDLGSPVPELAVALARHPGVPAYVALWLDLVDGP